MSKDRDRLTQHGRRLDGLRACLQFAGALLLALAASGLGGADCHHLRREVPFRHG